ncbi:2-keto-4-pentenoate hydratase [Salipiger abyssi]|uniref:2-keto-4-pentenoate hydratase n=1 Tax=Salipiger abyssi TaxID=1250539 RepID=UPI001A8D46C8|nr:fumarylacetoacetate hydrolase family protein [Salipiger abyssi]MBN9887539.1 fumarylacetoacetate hydrolase family protein [Salipiger abyssi]
MFRATLAALAIIPLGGAAFADCASDADIAAFAQSYLSRTPATALGTGGDIADALCTQVKLAELLAQNLGPVVGYKAGLTSKPAQERFGVTAPVRGVLYRDMLLEDGATVASDFGAVPMLEADLLMIVGDDRIAEATTPEEVMRHVSALRPFIELPDLTLAKGEPLTGETLTAMGVGPRLGVMGPEIAVTDPEAMTQALATMAVTLTDADGTVMSEAPGAAVLGHPANALLWLMQDGVKLKAGDIVSVGSFGPLFPIAKAGGGATLHYAGLPDDPEISVRFSD